MITINTSLTDDLVTDIPVEEYRLRIERVRQAMAAEDFDALVVYSNPWHMSNCFWLGNYRSFDGISPDPTLILLPLEGDLTLFTEKPILPYARDTTWIPDVRPVRPGFAEGLEDFRRTKKPKKIGLVGSQYFALEFYRIVEGVFGRDSLHDTDMIDRLKCIRSEREIHLMKVAGWLADQSLVDLKATIRDGMSEREAAQIMHTSLFQNGADSQAFDVMVQSGVNAGRYCLARPTEKKIRKGELLLIDTGVRYRNYVSDMGRGFAFGEVSREQQRLLDVALAAYRAGIPYLKPGLTCDRASEAIDAVLRENGFGSAHTAAGNRKCGHGLGNDPEEEYPVMGRPDHVLQENMGLAYELTVQTPELGGCRVEDVVIIRKDGPEFLTHFERNTRWD
ncbi:MAG: Xaa-Pro peptidase family protein [Planctomycetes bacterium]|nr:Xaa-Pro peptidase family protein [Planctomycetota bacterium]